MENPIDTGVITENQIPDIRSFSAGASSTAACFAPPRELRPRERLALRAAMKVPLIAPAEAVIPQNLVRTRILNSA